MGTTTSTSKNLAVFEEVIKMLITNYPCDFFVKQGGVEVSIFLNHGSQKGIVLRVDGTWDYESQTK